MKSILIRHHGPNSLGDVMLMTALVRDIHKAYPGQYRISVSSNYKNIWWHNPYIVPLQDNPVAERVAVHWAPSIRTHGYIDWPAGRTPRHILAWYHHTFFEKTGVSVPVTLPRPDLHTTEAEAKPLISGRYWVIVAGGKSDATVKHWHNHRAQEVVDALRDYGISFVQVGALDSLDMHKPLGGVLNLLGKTPNERDLWNVIRYADGVVCGVTGPMHAAAAFEKPCVVYAGGREDPWFEAYVNDYGAFGPGAEPVRVPHRFLHTIGRLPCCNEYGCWATRTVPIRDQLDPKVKTKIGYKMCLYPIVSETRDPVPACQDLITSEQVVAAVLSYYEDGTLQHVSEPQKLVFTPPPPPAPPDPPAQVSLPVTRPVAQVQPARRLQVLAAPRKEPTLEPLKLVQVPELQHSRFGGKITIFVLCYGNYPELARRCIGSILRTVPVDSLDLRIGANAAAEETVDYLYSTPASRVYIHEKNDFKYPVMREMCYDAETPITTKYFAWFDDDTWIVRSDWLVQLCRTILATSDQLCGAYGTPMFHDTAMYAKNGHNPRQWFQDAVWHQGRNMHRAGRSAAAADGSLIHFPVGWHWAMRTETMHRAQIPDSRLQHNGGDITIGEQIHQLGLKIHPWNLGKQYVACPSREGGGRRGFSQSFPWSARS